MHLKCIWMLFIGYIVSVRGYQEFSSANCLTEGIMNCSQYIICTEDVDTNVHPGRIKTLVHDIYIPRGLTQEASLVVSTPSDMSVIISDVNQTYQDDSFTLENGTYIPVMTERTLMLLTFSRQGTYLFGDIDCSGNRVLRNAATEATVVPPLNASHSTNSTSTCTYCMLKVAVEYLMADITDVSDRSTRVVTATMVSKNVTMEVSTTLVLRTIQNTSVMSNFSTDIPDQAEFPYDKLDKFEIRMNLQSPLSAYKLELESLNPILKIVSVRTLFIGEHYEDIIPTVIDPGLCSGGWDTKVLDFGYLPNKGYYDSNASAQANIVVFEIVLSLRGGVVGKIYPIYIDMEVDFVKVMNSTKYFNIIPVTRERVNITTIQKNKLLPKSGESEIRLVWYVPPLSFGVNYIRTSTKRYSGPGEDGLAVAGVAVGSIGCNMPCVHRSLHWKANNGAVSFSNIGYTNGYSDNIFTYRVYVVVLPDLAEAGSSHELTVNISYPGEGSPQAFKFYINVTDQEIFTAPDRYGNLPLNIYLYEQCRSITHSTDVDYILHTNFDRPYGRVIAELPMPAGAMGQAFRLCNFGIVFKGRNIYGRFTTTTIRGDDEMIEKIVVDISPLTNVYFATYDKRTVNYVTMKMLVTYTDQNIQVNESTMSFIARLISNNKTIWTGELPVPKPSIEYYPNFIVMTEIVKIADVNPQNLSYHYSRNGTYYYQDKIEWESGRNDYVFEFPKVIAYFYFSTTPCTVVCNVTTDWLPLTYYVTFVKDDNNVLLRKLPYALDQDLNTCFDLPLAGDSPAMMWLIITQLSLFGVTSQKFRISITGDGIECARVGQKTLRVGTSGTASDSQCSIDSDITFCKLVSDTTIAAKTQCDVECDCDTLSQCSDVHILMQSSNNDDWRMCELTINDI